MLIKKIERVKGRKNIFKIFSENEKSFLLSADAIVKFELKEGKILTEVEFKEILSFDKSGSVIADALLLVGKHPYGSKSLYDKLIIKGHDPRNAQAAVDRLKKLNYLNDAKFAADYVQYLKNKGKGEFVLRHELERHLADKNIIDNILKTLREAEEPHERIIGIIRKNFKKLDFKDKNEVRKAAAFFLRRGFSSENIAKALREYKGVNLDEN
ncbi:MAG: recombination regulator RecX [Endomicrobium sp.]|jgi:regulatory protein|nr:recombination regulator RecX [Endomicrobium sp.]